MKKAVLIFGLMFLPLTPLAAQQTQPNSINIKNCNNEVIVGASALAAIDLLLLLSYILYWQIAYPTQKYTI